MIIFDLDGTLADCEHRRQFIDPEKNIHILKGGNCKYYNVLTNEKWHPDWRAFYDACDQDKPILPVIQFMRSLWAYSDYTESIQIWSGRCSSVEGKTMDWLEKQGINIGRIKMRPIGDSTPDDVLKENWLNELQSEGRNVSFVVDDRPKVVRMWRKRGIFVFDVNQIGKDF